MGLDESHDQRQETIQQPYQIVPKAFIDLPPDKVSRAVCRVEAPGHGNTLGTGFLIAPRLILTNYHVIYAVDDAIGLLEQATKLEFRFGYKNFPVIQSGRLYKAKDEGALLAYSEGQNLDYALICLADTPHDNDGIPIQPLFPLFANNPRKLLLDEPIAIIQYPEGDAVKVAYGKVALEYEQRFQYNVNTLHGSSGSPIFDKHWNLVGLHRGNGPDPDNKSVPELGNEGIALIAILSKIKDLLEKAWREDDEATLVQSYLQALQQEFEKYDVPTLIELSMKPGNLGTPGLPSPTLRGLKELEDFFKTEGIQSPSSTVPPSKSSGEEQLIAFLGSEKALPGYTTEIPPSVPIPNMSLPTVTIEQFLTEYKRVILLGEPGSGKSTTLRRLVKLFGRFWQERDADLKLSKDWQGRIPIFVSLSHWQKSQPDLFTFLQEEIIASGSQELAKRLPTLMKAGRIVLLMDGLNELPQIERSKGSRQIIDIRAKAISDLDKNWPDVGCVISCRTHDFVEKTQWHDLHILGLRPEQIEAFADAWYGDYSQAEALKQGLMSELYEEPSRNKQKLRSLATQPFYLTKLLIFYLLERKLPSNHAHLLKFITEKALSRELEKGRLSKDEERQVQNHLSYLAFNMTVENHLGGLNRESTYRLLLSPISSSHWQLLTNAQREVKELSPVESSKASQILQWAQGAGLVIELEGKVYFYHQLFQEYYCAVFLSSQPFKLLTLTEQSPFLLVLDHASDEVWRLCAGLSRSFVENLLECVRELQSQSIAMYGWKKLFVGNLLNAYIVPAFAITTLAKIGEERAVEPLINLLKKQWGRGIFFPNNFGEVGLRMPYRILSIQALGQLGDRRAVEPLISICMDQNELLHVRKKAINALGELKDERAVEPLIKLLSSGEKLEPDETEINSVSEAFSLMFSRALETIKDAYTDGYKLINMVAEDGNDLRSDIISTLGDLGDRRAVNPLVTSLTDAKSDVRRCSAEALGKLGDREAVEALIITLEKDENTSVRADAAIALGQIGDRQAVNSLIAALSNEHDMIRGFAARALGQLGDEVATESLLALASKEKIEWVRSSAKEALERLVN